MYGALYSVFCGLCVSKIKIIRRPRDLIRAIQTLRKEKSLTPSEAVTLLVETDEVGKEFVNSALEEIKKPTNVSEIVFDKNDGEEIKVREMIFKLKIK